MTVDPVTLALGVGYLLFFGGIAAASVAGTPRRKHLAHDRAQAARLRRIAELEAQIHEAQYCGSFRTTPKDARALEAEAARLRVEWMRCHRWWYYGERR